MGGTDYFAPGDWNAICDQCGATYKASSLALQSDNARVCESCWDPRHPQEFVRPTHDPQGVPWSREQLFRYKEFATSRTMDASMSDTLTMG